MKSMAGFGGGVASLSMAGGGGSMNEWNPSNIPNAPSNVDISIMSGYPNILQIYYPTTVSLTSSSNTTNNDSSHIVLSNFDFTPYGSTSVTFYGIGAGGGGSIGPCNNGSGGGGSAFKIVVPVGNIRLSNVTLRTGQRGRGGHQSSARNQASSSPWGVAYGGYGGGQTSVTFNDGSSIYAGGGRSGNTDGCSSQQPGGMGNQQGGTGGNTGSLSFATFAQTWDGGDGYMSGHEGHAGGNAAFPGGYISGVPTAGAVGQNGSAGSGGAGTYGEGGKGCTVLSNAGSVGGTNQSGKSAPIDKTIMGCNEFSGINNGFGGGGGNAETDGALNSYVGHGGHGGMGAIFIELN